MVKKSQWNPCSRHTLQMIIYWGVPVLSQFFVNQNSTQLVCNKDGTWPNWNKFILALLNQLVCIYSLLLPWLRCDMRTIFKQRKASLNWEFSFLPRLKNPVCPHYIPIICRWRRDGFMLFFFQGHYRELKCKQTHPGFELGLIIIVVILRAPSKRIFYAKKEVSSGKVMAL